VAKLTVRISDFQTGKVRVVTYQGPREALEELRRDILKDRAAH
jgi:hypothetical protein